VILLVMFVKSGLVNLVGLITMWVFFACLVFTIGWAVYQIRVMQAARGACLDCEHRCQGAHVPVQTVRFVSRHQAVENPVFLGDIIPGEEVDGEQVRRLR